MYTPAVRSLSLQPNRYSRHILFSEAIRTCLELDILPSRKDFPRRFNEKDIRGDRYHSGRVASDPHLSSFPEGEWQYEELMQFYFWHGIHSPSSKHEPELYITGPVGCGKSTFIDFYLRHYCPERGRFAEEFNKKLVLYFNARALQYHAHANLRFFNALQDAIKDHCKANGIPLNPPPTSSGLSHAEQSIALLSEFCSSSEHLRYLVLVIDNLDNCSVEIQRLAVRYVNDIKNHSSINLYRVIIPLWPTTYDTFAQTTEALTTGKPRIMLGPPCEPEFIQKRLDVVKQQLIEETRLAVGTGLSSTLDACAEFQEFVDFVFSRLRTEQIGKFIRALCNSDMRRELCIWEGLLRSAAASHIFEVRSETLGRKFEYEWMEAVIAGDRRTRDVPDGQIANLFAIALNEGTVGDVLVGYHACQLLASTPRRRAWYSDMIRLGYEEATLEGLEIGLRKFNLLHPVPENFAGEEIEVHKGAVDAYVWLSSLPAYVDNMAMVTPVDSLALGQIVQTAGHIARDRQARVESSTAFIEFMCREEQEFMRQFNLRCGDDVGLRVKEQQWLDSKKILSASHCMADAYVSRLRGLVQNEFLPKEPWVGRCVERLLIVKAAFRRFLV